MSNLNVATPDQPANTFTYVIVGITIFIVLILVVIILWAIISARRNTDPSGMMPYSNPYGPSGYAYAPDPSLVQRYAPYVPGGTSLVNDVQYQDVRGPTPVVVSRSTNDPRNFAFQTQLPESYLHPN